MLTLLSLTCTQVLWFFYTDQPPETPCLLLHNHMTVLYLTVYTPTPSPYSHFSPSLALRFLGFYSSLRLLRVESMYTNSMYDAQPSVRDLDILKIHLFVLHNTDTISSPLFRSRFVRYNKQTSVLETSKKVINNLVDNRDNPPVHVVIVVLKKSSSFSRRYRCSKKKFLLEWDNEKPPQCLSKRGWRRGVVVSESRRSGFMCISRYRGTHLQHDHLTPDRVSFK
jgi:hypothetical protein